MPKDQQAVIEKFRRGMSGAAENYRLGIMNPKRPWKESAQSEEAEARYAAGVQRAAQQKSRQKAVARVSESDWRDAAVNVGAGALAASATKAGDNYAKVVGTVLAAGDAASQAAAQLPGTSISERLERARAAAVAVHRTWSREKGEQPEV